MKALIIVDVQNDFCPGGALAVPEGDQVVSPINALQPQFDLVVATQDWHPPGHSSFASSHGRSPGEVIVLDGLSQVMWPDHCVQGTEGAKLVPGLDTSRIARIFQKGTNPAIDSYSGFFDNGHRQATGLDEYLKVRSVDEIYVCGLATDYCVKWTVLDAIALGYKTFVVADATRGVELQPGDVQRALDEMKEAGAGLV